jgi:hypothetical protein
VQAHYYGPQASTALYLSAIALLDSFYPQAEKNPLIKGLVDIADVNGLAAEA